ncbi:MAG: hypothetical protein ACI4ED_08070 [Suilimivivens sp.]
MIESRVVLKERDEWSFLAEFIGNMVAKYADKIDFNSLPDPDVYLNQKYICKIYRLFQEKHKIINDFDVELCGSDMILYSI